MNLLCNGKFHTNKLNACVPAYCEIYEIKNDLRLLQEYMSPIYTWQNTTNTRPTVRLRKIHLLSVNILCESFSYVKSKNNSTLN